MLLVVVKRCIELKMNLIILFEVLLKISGEKTVFNLFKKKYWIEISFYRRESLHKLDFIKLNVITLKPFLENL